MSRIWAWRAGSHLIVCSIAGWITPTSTDPASAPRDDAERVRAEAERAGQEQRRHRGPRPRPSRAEGEQRGQRRAHRRDHERHRVHAAQLRDLDHRELGVLGVAEQAPGESAHEVPAQPLPHHPERGRERQRGPGPEPPREPRGRARHRAQVQAAVRGQRHDRQPRDRPGDRAVVEEGVIEPAQQDDVEHGAGEPAVQEGGARGARGPRDQRGHEPDPGEQRPVGLREGQRAQYPREREDEEGRGARPPGELRLRLHWRADRPGPAAVPRRGSSAPPPRDRTGPGGSSRRARRGPRSRSRRADRDRAAGPRCPR